MSLRDDLVHAIAAARDRAAASGALAIPAEAALPIIGMERPANPDHGDWASNAAMQLAPAARMAPMRIAQAIVDHLERPAAIASVEVAPPGFLNLRLDPGWVAGQVGPILEAGSAYGRTTAASPRRINVEFVSANPTGPLHVGNARTACTESILFTHRGLSGPAVLQISSYWQPGEAVQVNLFPDALPDFELTGEITEIGRAYTQQGGDILYTVRIRVN